MVISRTVSACLIASLLCSLAIGKAPNVVLILSDDQAWTDYGFMDHPEIKTPNLDRLARESIVFKRGYVPTSLCRPSLMTLATGHYAHKHGVTGNDPSPKYSHPNSELHKKRREQLIGKIDDFKTLPEALGELGYLSHQSGKWWEGNFSRGGFTHGMTRGFPQRGGRHGDDGLEIGREGLAPIADFVDDSIVADKPFFLWYAPFLPHTPHNPPKRLLDKYKHVESKTIAKYYAMCEWFDETCGGVMKILDDRKLRDDTLIIYVTDNGWIQNPKKNGYDTRSKQTPYEGGVRTPIMFSWPGKLKPSNRPELVSSIDIVPTILAATGADATDDLPGIDLWPYLTSGDAIDRDTIFGEGFSHDVADMSDPEETLLYRWCIQDEWKLILTYDGEVNRYQTTHPKTVTEPQLFNLITDPFEKKNVAKSHPKKVDALKEKIGQWYPLESAQLLGAPE